MDEHPSVRKRLAERNALDARIRPADPTELGAILRNGRQHSAAA